MYRNLEGDRFCAWEVHRTRDPRLQREAVSSGNYSPSFRGVVILLQQYRCENFQSRIYISVSG